MNKEVKDEVKFLQPTLEYIERSYEQGLERERKNYKERVAKAERLAQIGPELIEEGFVPSLSRYDIHGIYITTQKEKLSKLRNILGPLHVSNKTVVPPEKKRGRPVYKVKIAVRPKDELLNHIEITYVKPLRNTDKCKVVVEKAKEHRLVCSV